MLMGMIDGIKPVVTPPSSVIKSITQGSITLTTTNNTGTFTSLPSVDTTKTLLIWNGATSTTTTGNQLGRYLTRITLTNSTTVTATRENTNDSVTVYFTAIEFLSGVNSIQYGTAAITTGNLSATTTLGTATGANSFVIWLGASANTTLSDSNSRTGVSLNTGTHVVTANIGVTNSVTTTISFVVADLDTTIVNSIQQKSTTSAAASATDTDSITAITMGNTMIADGGCINAASTDINVGEYTGILTSTTGVTFTRNSAVNTSSRTHYYTIVQFAASCLNSNIQRPASNAAAINISAATSATATISSVSTSKSFVNWSGFNGTAVSNASVEYPALVLTNATTVTASLNTAGTVTVAWEVIEFK